ncbi:hypothetical protein [Chelativorans sp. AA-79]|uniref:hypothetical protein n=1 Tax=Chelativorans sp. AA-79 TaxID=3028735 RepID=UPI0023FA083D|nr:hypothetical protein [Chelativorans sp. AA-79]WEX12165.1 hypothetical protein PVE73_25915 [Chelativorans sp. AA-79]
MGTEFQMASIAVEPVKNAECASYERSTPVRVDAPEDKLDVCNKLILDSLEKDNFCMLNPLLHQPYRLD